MRFSLSGGMIPRTVKRMFDQRAELRRDGGRQSAVLVHRGRPHVVQLVNVSGFGAMIRFPQVPRIGESVALQLLDQQAADGHVRWVRDGHVGISFVTPLSLCEE